MILERTASSAFSEWVFRIGTFWIPYMLYLLMGVILIDFIRIANHFFHFLPPITQSLKLIVGITSLSIVTLVVIIGHINSMNVDIKMIPLTIDKKRGWCTQHEDIYGFRCASWSADSGAP